MFAKASQNETVREAVAKVKASRWAPVILAWITYAAWAYAIWGAWVPARAVGNILLGVDMAEAVKFLPAVRGGQIAVPREVFLLPQWTLALLLSVHAWQPRWPYPRWIRAALHLAACMTALSMLPPPWSPALLRAPEWRTQVILIGSALAICLTGPLWARLPERWTDTALAGIALVVGGMVGHALQAVWPEFTRVYHHPLTYGPGVWSLGVGVTALLLFPLLTPRITPQ